MKEGKIMPKKRFLTLVVCILCCITMLLGCGKADASAVEAYIEMAQQFIDNGDSAGAISILQKGYAETKDDRIAVMMADLSMGTDSNVEQTDPTMTLEEKTDEFTVDRILGIWAVDDISWQYGGLLAALYDFEDEILVEVVYVQGAPNSREAYCSQYVERSAFENGSVSFDFDDDGWENSGTVTLTYQENTETLKCEFSNVVCHGGPVWGFWDSVHELVRDEEAYTKLYYNEEDYYEEFPEENPDNWTEAIPVNDTSKASGILAELGLNEIEFRSLCQPLANSSNSEIISATELRDYPSNYLGQFYYYSSEYGNGFGGNESGNDYYEPFPFVVGGKGVSLDGFTIYYGYSEYDWIPDMVLFDLRDDIYSPTISVGDDIYPYMIFSGVQTIDGTDYVCFNLISVDKT